MIFTLYLTKNIIILHEKPLFLTSHRAISNNPIMLNSRKILMKSHAFLMKIHGISMKIHGFFTIFLQLFLQFFCTHFDQLRELNWKKGMQTCIFLCNFEMDF